MVVQMPRTAAIMSSLHLTFCVLILGLTFISLQTLSVTLMSGLCAGQVFVGIWFSVFHARVCLEWWGGAISSWKDQLEWGKHFNTAGQRFWSKMSIYFWKSIFPLTGTSVLTPLYIIQPQEHDTSGTEDRTPRHLGRKSSSSLRKLELCCLYQILH